MIITASNNVTTTLRGSQLSGPQTLQQSSPGVSEVASTLWRTSVSYVFGTGMSCPTVSTTTVLSYVSDDQGGMTGSSSSGEAPITSEAQQTSQRSTAAVYGTNATSNLPPSCPQTLTTYQPGSVVTFTSYLAAVSCPAMTTLPAVTSYVYRSSYPSPGRNASYITLTETVRDSSAYAPASATYSPSTDLVPATLTASNASSPPAATVYSCLSSVNGTLQAFPQASTLTVTSFVYGNNASALSPNTAPWSCSPFTTLERTTVTSFQYGANSTITVHVPGNASQCFINTTRETHYTTIYGADVTVTQGGRTTTLFYTATTTALAYGNESFTAGNTTISVSNSTVTADSSASASIQPVQVSHFIPYLML